MANNKKNNRTLDDNTLNRSSKQATNNQQSANAKKTTKVSSKNSESNVSNTTNLIRSQKQSMAKNTNEFSKNTTKNTTTPKKANVNLKSSLSSRDILEKEMKKPTQNSKQKSDNLNREQKNAEKNKNLEILNKINPEELANKKKELLNNLEKNSIQNKKIELLNKINKQDIENKGIKEKRSSMHREQYKKVETTMHEDIDSQEDIENLQDIAVDIEEEEFKVPEEEKTKEIKIKNGENLVKEVQEKLAQENQKEEEYLTKIKEFSKEDKTKKKRKKLHLKPNVKFIAAVLIFVISLVIIEVGFVNRNLIPHQPKINIDEPTESTEEPMTDAKLLEIQDLYQQNNDLVGWITIDGTKIDYPVMFTKGEDYYLRKDFYKKKSTGGTLYIDKHQTMEPKDINIIIHGHNMHDGTMFNNLLNYKKESFYEEHKKIVYYTLTERQEYEIIAVFTSKVYNVTDKVFKYYKFYGEQDENSYNDFIANIKQMSLYNIDLTATYPEELITLSTCSTSYSSDGGRFVVVAKRVS